MKNNDNPRLLEHMQGTREHRKAQAILRTKHSQRNPAAAAMASVFGAPVRPSAIDFDDVVLSVSVTR